MNDKHKSDGKRHKEMRKLCGVLRRMQLERKPDWIKRLRKQERTTYDQLQRLCGQLSHRPKPDTPRDSVFRFGSDGSVRPLESVFGVRDPRHDGTRCLRCIGSQALRKLVKERYADEWSSLSAMRPAALMYWLRERTASMGGAPADVPLDCTVSLKHSTQQAFYTLSEDAARQWGEVLVLREPAATVAESLARLQQLLEQVGALLQSVSVATSSKKRKKTEVEPRVHGRVLVLATVCDDEEEDEVSSDGEVTLGSADSITSDNELDELEERMDPAPFILANDSEEHDSVDDVSYGCESDDSEYSGEDDEDDDDDDDDEDEDDDDDESSQ